ncbi:hypothetical protein ACOMHN_015028 [Nucella lapillus]
MLLFPSAVVSPDTCSPVSLTLVSTYRCSSVLFLPHAVVPLCCFCPKPLSPVPLIPQAPVHLCRCSSVPLFPQAPVHLCRCSSVLFLPHAVVPLCPSCPVSLFLHALVPPCPCSFFLSFFLSFPFL